MTENVVVFVPSEFKELYPQFSKYTDNQLNNFFYESELLFNNSERSCIKDLNRRKALLFMIVAHLAQLQSNVDAGNTSVGRVASATEGSVSVSLDYGSSSDASRWWLQTPYGAKFWQFTAQYRTGLTVSIHKSMPVSRTGGRLWR